MKSVAVMQPYFFPYLGYYQLAFHVDQFVFLDNVSYIKGGHISRNSILLNGVAHRFTLSVKNISSFRAINEHHYHTDRDKFFQLLKHAYARAPHFRDGLDVVMSAIPPSSTNVADINVMSLMATFGYLGVSRIFSRASSMQLNPSFSGERRVIEICKQTQATEYINAPGGRDLYSAKNFLDQGIRLGFIVPQPNAYSQHQEKFVPNLSMIDVLMWNHPEQIIHLLGQYTIDFNAN